MSTTDTGLTLGWDTVYAMSLADLDADIRRRPSKWPDKLEATAAGAASTQTLAATVTGWRLDAATDADGPQLSLLVDISEGQLTATRSSGATTVANLAGVVLRIDLALKWLDGAKAGSTLLPNPDSIVVTVAQDPARRLDVTADAALRPLVRQSLQREASFAAYFAQLGQWTEADYGLLSWLRPTYVSYAVTLPADRSLSPADRLKQGIFAVLAMTENRDPTGLASQVSRRVIPAGAQAGFALHRRLFLNHLVKPGLPVLFGPKGPNQPVGPEDFALDNDEQRVSNSVKLGFAPIQVSDNHKIEPYLAADKFSVGILNNQLRLNLETDPFTWQAGVKVALKHEATVALRLVNDRLEFVGGVSTTTPTVEVEAWVTAASVLGGIAAAVLGAAAGALVGSIVEGGTEMTQAAELGAVSSLGKVVTNAGVADVQMAAAQEAGISAAELAATRAGASAPNQISAFLARNMTKLKAAMLGSLPGVVVGVPIAFVETILRALATRDTQNMPAMSKFAESGLRAIVWPGERRFHLTSVQLDQGLLLGGLLVPMSARS